MFVCYGDMLDAYGGAHYAADMGSVFRGREQLLAYNIGSRSHAMKTQLPKTGENAWSIGDVFSAEFLFICFIFAGSFKASEMLGAVNQSIDLTVALCGASIVAAAISFGRTPRWPERRTREYLLTYAMFAAAATLSFLSQPGGEGASLKIQKLLVFDTWALLGPVIMCRHSHNVDRLLRLALVFAICLGIEAIIQFVRSGGGFIGSFGGDGYHWVGRISGIGVAIATARVAYSPKASRRFMYALICMVLLLAVLVSLTRQAVVGVAIVSCYFAYVLVSQKTAKAKLWRLTFTFGCLALLAIAIYGPADRTAKAGWSLERIQTLGDVSEMQKSNRWAIWSAGLDVWAKSPMLGAGFGRFSEADDSGNWRHPHNLFVETLCELGLVGLVPLLAMVLVPVAICWSAPLRNDGLLVAVAAPFLFLLVCAMFSGDITDNRQMLAFAGAVVSTSGLQRRDHRLRSTKDHSRAAVLH